MATTTYADNTASAKTLWADDLFAQAESKTFWGQWEGEPGSSMPLIRRDDLERDNGDTIKVDIVLALAGAGQNSELAAIEGNEEALQFRQQSVTVGDLGHGVSWNFKAQRLLTHDMRKAAKNQLAKWLAGKLDDAVFNEFVGRTGSNTIVPTTGKWFAGSATTRDTVADSDGGGRLQLVDLTDIKAYAQAELKIEPIRIDGDDNEYFGVVLHDYAVRALKRYDTNWAQAQRDAQVRSAQNPLFTGAAGMWDGCILFTNTRVPRYANSGSVQVADNIFFGAQAMSRAWAMYPDWVEESFDYGRRLGIATTMIKGEKLNVFDLTAAGGASAANLTAIGSMVLYTAATAPSA